MGKNPLKRNAPDEPQTPMQTPQSENEDVRIVERAVTLELLNDKINHMLNELAYLRSVVEDN